MRMFRRRQPAEFGWFAEAPLNQRHTATPDETATLRVSVPAQTHAVAYRHGRFFGVLEPGRHWLGRGVTLRRVDLREQREQLAPQEIPTADGALVKVTVSFGWRVTDAQRFVEHAADPLAEVYLAIQVALREALIGREIDDIAVAPRLDNSITGALAVRASEVGERVGIEVFELVVKDVILPAEWRRAMLAIKTARLDGLAKLEAARADTAALRAMANQAQLLESHPELAKLQLMRAAASSGRLELHYAPFD